MFSRIDDYTVLQAKEAALGWVAAQTYDVMDAVIKADTAEDVWVEIALNAPHGILMELGGNRKISDKVLGAICMNNTLNLYESYDLAACISKHSNCSADTIVSLWNKIQARGMLRNAQVLKNIAAHKNTPGWIIEQMLPNHESLRSANLCRENFQACYSKNIPARTALQAAYSIKGDAYFQGNVWSKQFSRFVHEHKKLTGINIKDWPKEWIEELIK